MYVFCGQTAPLEQMFLHLVDNFRGLVYVLRLAADYQVGLPRRYLNVKLIAQQTQVTIRRPEKLKLPMGRI